LLKEHKMSWYDKLKSGVAVKEKCAVKSKVPDATGIMTTYGKYNIQNSIMVGTINEDLSIAGEWNLTGTANPAGDALLLPWAENRICWGELTGAQDKFLTYQMNGCGLIVSGSRASPIVVHANENGDNLTTKLTSLTDKKSAAARARERCAIYQDVLTHLQSTIPGFAGDVATWFPGEDYSYGGAFGVKTSGVWKIFGHSAFGKNSTTKLIWPVDATDDSDNKNACKCCYISTAVCESMGLPDDCDELQTLRWFRDQVMNSTVDGQRDVASYYANAPRIVAAIDSKTDAAMRYRHLYQQTIRPAVAAVHQGNTSKAYSLYRQMVLELEALML
jgi:hypothetical protein